MMMKSNQTYRTTRQSGVGLIEVLIALLIFSVGLLGMVTVQLGAKRSSYEATQQSIATSLARDIFARMRSNPDALASYVVNELGSAVVPAGTNCNTTPCTSAQLAVRDIYEWNELLKGVSEKVVIAGVTSNAGGLVDYRACVTNTLGFVQVAISWKGINELTNPTTSTCGQPSGLYGVAHENRRLLLINSYIGA